MLANMLWDRAVVESTQDLTPSVREFVLRPTGQARAHGPGSHLQVQVPVNGQVQTRHYSLVGADDGQIYRIAVKHLPQGRGGSRAMWALRAGDELSISAPIQQFALALDAPAYWLVAGGIGVTPLVRMAQNLAGRGANVRMIYGVRHPEDLAYLEALQAALGAALQIEIGQSVDFEHAIAQLPAATQAYVCGPAPMFQAVQKAWAGQARAPADLRFETFGASQGSSQSFQVHLPRHQRDITVPADSSLLEALELAGVPVLSNCRRGECGLCVLPILSLNGTVEHRDVYLSSREKQSNERLCACVSRVQGSVTLDTAYRPDR
jgi:ferredoxin-NADP reductase